MFTAQKHSGHITGTKRQRSAADKIDWASPFAARAKMEQPPAQEGSRPFGASKSMGHLGHQLFSSGRNSSPSYTDVAVQQPITYSSLDDISARVEIYKGRHSIVWNAICAKTRKPIILKGYVKAKMTERNFHQVRREIRLMQQINYDGAVKLFGHFEDATTIYLVQEMCAKGDLFKKLIRSGGQLDEKFVAGEVILPMLLTLEHLHARSIYHRDIKPENIFFSKEGKFKLGDFGLAIDASLERSKSRVGTLDYMSPEVVSLPTADDRKKMEQQGRKVIEQPYGEKCDIWACGILAYELLVGKPPFEVKDETETRRRIMYETTLTIPAHVSLDAVNFIKTALAKNSGMRPTASELVHHPWLRPYLLQMAAASGQLDAATLSAYKNGAPSSLAASSCAAAGTLNNSAGTSSSSSSTAIAANPLEAAGGVGRSASFTQGSKSALSAPGGRLQLNVNVGEDSLAGASGVADKLGRHVMSHLSVATNHVHGTASPAMPTTPGPYGPPGMSRKPVWESEFQPSGVTAVRTTNMNGEMPQSPSGATTSPRPKLSFLSSNGGCNPLLKAAINANLNRLNNTAVSSPGALSPKGGAAGSLAQQQQLQQHQQSVSSNVKQRLKEYFVARNPEVMVTGAGGAAIAAGGVGGSVASDGQQQDWLEDTHEHLLLQPQQ